MNKQEIYDFIKNKNIWYEITDHKAFFNMEELSEIEIPYPEYGAKNLFVRDDKKRNYYLITVKGNKRVDLKEFRNDNNTRPLSFASEQDLMSIMNLIAGSVTAWFMWQLQGDAEASKVFIGDNPELLNNNMYQDQRIDLNN